MKSLVIFALLLAFASAFDLRGLNAPQRIPLMPVVDSPNGRITNGQIAAANQFPYQAGLSLSDGVNSYWCGGSLISNEWVLTAAHCTVGIESVTVQLGSVSRLRPAVSLVVQKSNIITHANYNADTIRDDIALIKIPRVTYTNAIQPVALPKISSSYPTYAGDVVVASGWGRTSDASQSTPTQLQYADFTVITNAVCARSYGTAAIDSGKICVSSVNSVSTCNGDSGGPLVLKSSKVLIGLTSFGSAAGCELNYPLAFTRVTSYLNWIQDNTGLSL